MTQPLAASSPRRIAAGRFGAELRRAMHARQVGSKTLGPQAGCAPSAIGAWLAGRNLPRLDTAVRLAESLRWPKLIAIAREGRVAPCEQCGAEFVNEGGQPKRFCTQDCRDINVALRTPPPGRSLAEAVRAELVRVHGRSDAAIRRRPLAAALAEYSEHSSRNVLRVDRSARRLTIVQAAVASFCRACEPNGICRAPECELRPVSPLPLALRPEKIGAEARKAEGAHGPTNGPVWLAAQRAANARRWGRPGERERQGEITAARFATMSDDERIEHARRVSIGRRRPRVPA